MTVRELIQKLESLPQDLPVVLYRWGNCYPVGLVRQTVNDVFYAEDDVVSSKEPVVALI